MKSRLKVLRCQGAPPGSTHFYAVCHGAMCNVYPWLKLPRWTEVQPVGPKTLRPQKPVISEESIATIGKNDGFNMV